MTVFFKVLFFGNYIPLHGVEYILQAAKLLENEKVSFLLIGGGQERKKMEETASQLRLNNLNFVDFMKPELLRQEITKADVCLGIFGDTQKTRRVIPNKVYICSAMRKPIISADTPAMRELFDDDEILFVKEGDVRVLADAILSLKIDRVLAKKMAENCRAKFQKTATPEIIGEELKKIIGLIAV